MGKPVGDMTAREYFAARADMLGVVEKAYRGLAERNDVIVIEGAGSPAEINLKDSDIVNMKMAEMADAPVLLATDVDRGGAFAWIVGTLKLLKKDERSRLAGFIFNKFRGDPALIKDGLEALELRTGIPVLGLIPYLKDIGIDEEDSVWLDQFDAGTNRSESGHNGSDVDIAVIKLPRVSNFTDFNILGKEAHVRLRYVDDARALGRPDLVILPGTKSTISDLLFIRQNGLAQAITELARNGTMVIGICGGYQMLGTQIEDNESVESSHSSMEGLGLLDVSTTFFAEKQTYQARAVMAEGNPLPFHVDADSVLSGYEIHMGDSQCRSRPLLRITERGGKEVNIADGAVSEDGRVAGTYLHGIFDNDQFRRQLIKHLMKEKGTAHADDDAQLSSQAFKEQAYDRLADVVQENLSMDPIYRAMGLERP
jgi:adenosylcobyric acid synthase